MAEKEEAAEEYVSDIDDAPLPAVRRRAVASDDDEEDEGGGGGGTGLPLPSGVFGSDADAYSDGQGASEVYDEDEGSVECEEVHEEFDAGGRGGEAKGVADEVVAAPEEEGKYEEEEAEAEAEAAVEREDKEKKWGEPYAVPRTGAFYMHDDRFQNQENGSHGRQREFSGAQKLWYPKDDRVWVHDLFDEMNIDDAQPHYARRPIGPCRTWAGGRTQGVNDGYLEGTKPRSYYHDDRTDYKYIPKESHTRYDSTKNYNRFPKESNTSYENAKDYRSVPRKFYSYHDDNNFDNARRESYMYYGNAKGYSNAPNIYRGKPSSPFQPHWSNTFEISSVHNNRSQNKEVCSNAGVRKHCPRTLSLQHESNTPQKQTFASNLNSASLSFCPSRSSRQELPFIQRRKARPQMFSKLFSSSVRMAHGPLKPKYRPVFRVKVCFPSGGHGKVVDSLSTVATEGMLSPASRSSVSTSNNYSQYSKSRDQGRGLNIGERTKNKFSSTTSQAARSYTESNNAEPFQPAQRASTQMSRQKIASTNKTQSHSQTTPISSTEDAGTSTPPGSNDSIALSEIIGQNDKEETESASSPSGGGHVLGVTEARSLTLGDQDFNGSPALLPVMQLSGQQPTGPGIPSIGMAFPGFLAHQQLGSNSEMIQMTWLPILTGATGALGATYSSSYFGSYYTQPSEFPSSSVSPRGHSATFIELPRNTRGCKS